MDREIRRLHLRVDYLDGITDFYCDLLGMGNFGTKNSPLLGYRRNRCLVEFTPSAKTAYQHQNRDLYWKMGVVVLNLDHAVEFLRRQGWSVSDPIQFEDIGYLCHLEDPKGFIIELLQQGFEGRQQSVPAGHPIGVQASIAHVTLRANHIDAAKRLCEQQCQMRLMSVQPVPKHGFTLYFYAGSTESPPDPDLTSVHNREWLWARPYAMMEWQQLTTPTIDLSERVGGAGFTGITYGPAHEGASRHIDYREIVSLLSNGPS